MERTVLPRADDPMLSSKTPWYFYDGGFVEAGKTPEETLGHWRNPNTVVVDGPPNYYDAHGNGSATWAPGYKQAVRDGVASTFIPTEYRNNPRLWAQKQAEWARSSGNATVAVNYNNRQWETQGFYYGGGPDSMWDMSGKNKNKNKKKKKKYNKYTDFETSEFEPSEFETSEFETSNVSDRMPLVGSQCVSRGPSSFQACCDNKAATGTSDPSCPAARTTPSPAVSGSAPTAAPVDDDESVDDDYFAEYPAYIDIDLDPEPEPEDDDLTSEPETESKDIDAEYEMNVPAAAGEVVGLSGKGMDGFESFRNTLALAPARIGQAFGSLWPGWYSWDQLPIE